MAWDPLLDPQQWAASPVVTGTAASLLAGLATGLGALPVFAVRDISARLQDMMLGFGAGVMLAATFFSLLDPALEAGVAITGGGMSAVAMVSAGFLLGGTLFWGADRLLPHEHFISGPEGGDPAMLRRIWLFVIAITIHNFPEGLAVGVGFGLGEVRDGLPLALGIAMQNVPEGLVAALALASQGYSRRFAALVALLTGLVEPIGGLFGAAVVGIAHATLPLMMALAAGAMLYVISAEIIPETHRKGFERAATASLMVGFVIMMILDTTLG